MNLLGATSEYCQIGDGTIVLTKFRCENYYGLFIEKLVSEPSAVRAWKKSFSELSDWGDCFVNIYSESSPKNKLRQFTFKVVHRIITTKKELLKYKLASDDKCPFCLNPDWIEHTFLYCQESKEFFSKTLRWFNEYRKENVQLSYKKIVLNSTQTSSVCFTTKEILECVLVILRNEKNKQTNKKTIKQHKNDNCPSQIRSP